MTSHGRRKGESPAPVGAFLRIHLDTGFSIGPGKIALLEQIDATGSLSQAARVLGMSYRRAWTLLDALNSGRWGPATTTSVGGSGGGGAALTDFGRKLIRLYRDIESNVLSLSRSKVKAAL